MKKIEPIQLDMTPDRLRKTLDGLRDSGFPTSGIRITEGDELPLPPEATVGNPDPDDNEWKQYRAEQKARREARLPIRQDEIEALEQRGFRVLKLTEYQYRINGQIDIYPIHRRYHILKKGKRGNYQAGALFRFLHHHIKQDQ